MRSMCLAIALALASLAAFVPAPAMAARSYDNCSGFVDSVPATITTQGVWCLRADLSTAIASGNAVTISANNVTLDCNDFKLGGLAAGNATAALGVRASSQLNVVIRNCNIRGFREGISVVGGGGHVVEHSRFDGNTYIAIRMNSDDSSVRGNLVLNTGGSTAHSSYFGIVASFTGGNIDVIDNTVSGVVGVNPGETVYGIWVGSLQAGSISNNRLRGLVPGTGGTSVAIQSAGDTNQHAVHDNVLHGSNIAGSFGIRCFNNLPTAYRNFVRNFATGVQSCWETGNISPL